MAILKSLYSAAVTAFVPTDTLAPKEAIVGTINGTQITTAEPKGKSQITINWTLPTENEMVTEFLGTADATAQTMETRFDPIVVASEIVYEVTDQAPVGGGSTTLSLPASKDDNEITVALITNFAVGEWIQILEGGEKQYFKITAIAGSVITLSARINVLAGFTVAATVKEVTISVAKVDPTDYSLVDSTGVFTLVAGQFTNTNDVIVEYTTTLQDLDHIELYRVPGNKTVTNSAGHSRITRDAVLATGGVVTVSTTILSSSIQHVETLTAAENGSSWTYYLFCVDNETSPNISFAMQHSSTDGLLIEMLTGIPQSLSTAVSTNAVTISWASVVASGENANADGYSIYRVSGLVFSDNAAEIVNNAIIAAGTGIISFDDSAANVTNRVAIGTLAAPIDGNSYSYKVESEDTATGWTTGTNNQSLVPLQSAVTLAAK